MEDLNLDLSQFEEFAKEEEYSIADWSDPVSRSQVTLIYSLFSELDLDKNDFKIKKVSELNKRDASVLIEELLQLKEEKDEQENDEAYEEYFGEIGEDLEW